MTAMAIFFTRLALSVSSVLVVNYAYQFVEPHTILSLMKYLVTAVMIWVTWEITGVIARRNFPEGKVIL